jgi:hypothetical protein
MRLAILPQSSRLTYNKCAVRTLGSKGYRNSCAVCRLETIISGEHDADKGHETLGLPEALPDG